MNTIDLLALKNKGKCACIPPYSCCSLCCGNSGTIQCHTCKVDYNKEGYDQKTYFEPIIGNYKKIKVVKPSILEIIIQKIG